MTRPLLLAAALALAPVIGLAESHEAQTDDQMGHPHHDMAETGAMPSAMQAYMDAMDGMMRSMPMESSGDADADFLLMMIPHHQSAIDMARAELDHGDDAETRALAQAIIDAQEAEIARMRGMLARLGVEAPPAP